jgi:hypothetical protein
MQALFLYPQASPWRIHGALAHNNPPQGAPREPGARADIAAPEHPPEKAENSARQEPVLVTTAP